MHGPVHKHLFGNEFFSDDKVKKNHLILLKLRHLCFVFDMKSTIIFSLLSFSERITIYKLETGQRV